MRWQGGRESDNVEDERGSSGGGPGGMVLGLGGTLVVVVLALVFGIDPQALLQQINQGPGAQINQAPAPAGAPVGDAGDDELKKFVRVVLGDTEDVWEDLFQRDGKRYEQPKLVLYTGEVRSACGFASAAVGPFYCPGDAKVYLDLGFFDELRNRFHVEGNFPEAYVIAHEIGHHVQNLLGISEQVSALQQRSSKEKANALSVRLELQADFFAGVWANHAQEKWKILEEGDVEKAMNCAAAIGDDRLQMQARGYVVPDSFTHGTSAQRARWFRRGLDTGDMKQGDTFGAREL
jgi:predicted metalloprotease